MPGNDLGDRVHNFFAQDNLLQGQPHSQVQEGSWPVLNSDFWVGGQGQVDQLNSNSKIYNTQNSDVDRGETGYSHLPHHLGNGLNLSQSNLRPEQPNLNGFFYANPSLQARQNEASFLGMDTGSDNLNSITSRGLLAPDVLQKAGASRQTKASDRSEASASPVSFDLFGVQPQMNHGQQRINHEQSSTTQSLPHQQQLQQQLMMKKLQEIQLQQQHNRQLDLRQQYLGSQLPSFAKQSSNVQSTLVNGITNSDASVYPQPAAVGTSWLNQGSSSMHGSPNGLGFPPNLGQTQGLVDLATQEIDNSLYGVPVSSSRGLNVDHHSQMVTSRVSIPQMPVSSNFLQGNQPNLFPDHVGVQGESPMSRHKIPNDDMFGYGSKQSQFLGLGNMGSQHQANYVSGNQPQKQSSLEQPSKRVTLPQNEVGLDPTEEKILFGSDDNIWAAFGKESNGTGEAALSSIQSGSWSALMQSAVAETSSKDTVLQGEWSGLSSQKNNGISWSQSLSFPHNSFKQERPLVENSKRMPSALNSGSFPPSDNTSNYATTSKQRRQKFQNEPHQRLQTEASPIFFQSMGETDKSRNCGPLRNSVAERSQYRDAAQPYPWAERNSKTTEFLGISRQSNGTAVPTEGVRVMNSNGAENLLQNSNNQIGVTQGKVSHGSSFWKSNSVPISSMELNNVNSRASDPQANQGHLSLKETTSVDNSHNARKDETSSQFQNSYSFKKWTNVHPSSRSQGGESLGMLNQANGPNQVLESICGLERDESARLELESHDVKENSNDSHHSNLSQHSVRGLREGGVLDMTDSHPATAGMQNLANQLFRKVSAPLKFQYHPTGNVEEDVDPAYGLKQPSHVQTIHQKNAHFGQAKIFGQVTQNSTLIGKGQCSELQRDIRGPYEKPSCGDLSGHVHDRPAPHNHHAETLSSASSSSQNMLELFNKVDHSRNHGAMVQLNASVSSSQPPVVEKHDEFGHLQHNQSHVSQGFGLQLGPPSQQLQISNCQMSSHKDQGAFNLVCSNKTDSEKGDKSPQMVAKNSVQSLPSKETQPDFELNISTIPGHGKNDDSLYKAPGNFTSLSSGVPYARHDQDLHIAGLSGQMPLNWHIDSLSQNASSTQRAAQAILHDAYGGFQHDHHASLGAMSEQSGPDVREQGATATVATRDGEQSSHHFPVPGLSQQGNSLSMLQNMGANIPLHRLNTGFEVVQTSSQNLELPQPNIVESSDPLMQDHVNSFVFNDEGQRLVVSAGQQVASGSTEAVSEAKKSFRKGPFLKNQLDNSHPSSASMRENIEAFGRSLKPNTLSNQTSTLQNQSQVSNDAETDSGDRVSKRMKGQENVSDVHTVASKPGQQLAQNDVVGDSLGSSRLVGNLQRNPSQDGNVATQDDSGISRDISPNDSCIDLMTSPGVDHHQVNPKMAPLLFGPCDAPGVNPSKPGEQSLPQGKCSGVSHIVCSEENRATAPADACQNSNHQNLTILSVANRGVSSVNPLQLNATSQDLVILRPKKRKSAILDLYPWHKEISEFSQDHDAPSMTESNWDLASNCLIDKVDDTVDLIEDGSLVHIYKRRLILTTHLIQKLFRSAPAAILSADATTRHDALVYAVSRITLGDACNTLYLLRRLDVLCEGMDQSPNSHLSVRNGVQSYAKAAEELRGRIKKLKNDFSRLYKNASILDLRFECLDLERVSVIHRFARFHGRSQSDNAEPASASASATSHKPIPQRYVTALPFPTDIPDGVQCLSL